MYESKVVRNYRPYRTITKEDAHAAGFDHKPLNGGTFNEDKSAAYDFRIARRMFLKYPEYEVVDFVRVEHNDKTARYDAPSGYIIFCKSSSCSEGKGARYRLGPSLDGNHKGWTSWKAANTDKRVYERNVDRVRVHLADVPDEHEQLCARCLIVLSNLTEDETSWKVGAAVANFGHGGWKELTSIEEVLKYKSCRARSPYISKQKRDRRIYDAEYTSGC